jgi:acyl carrier protein
MTEDQQSQAATPEQRSAKVKEFLTVAVAKVLRVSPENLDHTRSLLAMGVDSMMAMELQVAIERNLAIKLSALELMKGNSFSQLIENIARMTEDQHEAAPGSKTGNGGAPPPAADVLSRFLDIGDADDIAQRIEGLTDDEVAQALNQLQSMSEATGAGE